MEWTLVIPHERDWFVNRTKGSQIQIGSKYSISDEVLDAPTTTSICLCVCEQRPRNSKSRIPRIERGVEPLQEWQTVEEVKPVESTEVVDDEVDRTGDAAKYGVQLCMK